MPDPPSELMNRVASVQTNIRNTLKMTCDLRDQDWSRWFDQSLSRGVYQGNEVEGLIDGEETFRSMIEAIRTTGSETGGEESYFIYMLNWYVDLDFNLVPGINLITLLSSQYRRNVQIRAMFWDQVGTQNNRGVEQISNLKNGAAILDNNTLNLGAHHQKILIVKGQEGLIAFCGGVDPNPDRIASVNQQSGSPMHDVHCRIKGPAARELLTIFCNRWTDHPRSLNIDNKKGALIGLAEPTPAATGDKYVQIGCTFGNGSRHAGITSRNGNRWYSFAQNGETTARSIIFHAIREATSFIYIEDQYLISMEASSCLQAQLPKIKRLIILIPHSSISDLPRVWTLRRNFIDNLMSAPDSSGKVAICYRIDSNQRGDTRTVPPRSQHTYIHAKIFVIDDKFAIIGSANCNNRGYTHDSEVVAGIFDESSNNEPKIHFAHELRLRLWAEHLNRKKAEVFDPIASSCHWFSPPSDAHIALYDPRAGTDSWTAAGINQIDPIGE